MLTILKPVEITDYFKKVASKVVDTPLRVKYLFMNCEIHIWREDNSLSIFWSDDDDDDDVEDQSASLEDVYLKIYDEGNTFLLCIDVEEHTDKYEVRYER